MLLSKYQMDPGNPSESKDIWFLDEVCYMASIQIKIYPVAKSINQIKIIREIAIP